MTPENKELFKEKKEILPFKSLFGFKELKAETFLALPEDKRMAYITNPVMKNVDDIKKNNNEININFTFLNGFNKELRADISAGQVLPDTVGKVKFNNRIYQRNGLKGEFFTVDGTRLVIHQGVKLKIIGLEDKKEEGKEIERILKTKENNNELLKEYLKINTNHIDLEDLIRASIDEGMNPYLAVFIFGDKLRKTKFSPINRKIEIEKFLKDFSKLKGGLDEYGGVEWKKGNKIINKSYSSDLIAPFMKKYVGEGYVKKVKDYYKQIDNDDIDEKIIVDKGNSRRPKFLKQKQIEKIIKKAPKDLKDAIKLHFPEKEWSNALVVVSNEGGFSEVRSSKRGQYAENINKDKYRTHDKGYFQLNDVHKKEYTKLGLNPFDTEDNVKFASILFNRRGNWRDWYGAKKAGLW